ncbi:MAG: 3-dehydroquinate synthase [Bacteriovoracaceae bacterium]|nr:3-dehydroquinate synthase [Bacteriovoracaceae bacterium]
MTSKILSYKQLELANALERKREKRIFAILDSKIKNMLPQWLQFSPDVFWMQTPEDQKNLETFAEACEFFLKQGIQRGDYIIAVGGGATTDFAGFVAATIHRGIHWIAVPTTLMGMVDAAIGGKTALNMPLGKNLIGAFHEPEEVWICTDYLRTLSSHDVLSGKGEILKYGLLNQEIYDLIMTPTFEMEELILKCANYKQSVVMNDLRDQSQRVFFNLGHTLGHAFEHVLRIPHGIAITMGIKYLFKAYDQKEGLQAFDKLFKKLDLDEDKTDLSQYSRFNKKDFWQALSHDKKRTSDGVNLVLLDKIGAPKISPTNLPMLKSRLEALSDFKG